MYPCRNALVGIVKTGGLPSLYAGWAAVLCRNVPHSVIKVRSIFFFYVNQDHFLFRNPFYLSTRGFWDFVYQTYSSQHMQFYTYESLKQWMLPSYYPNAQPNTLQTVCLSVFWYFLIYWCSVFTVFSLLGNFWLVMLTFWFKPMAGDAAFEEQYHYIEHRISSGVAGGLLPLVQFLAKLNVSCPCSWFVGD